MNRAFLEAYNRELAILYERSKEFAEDYPGIAERLGGLTQDKLDPGIAGLMEGAAFMAARVQLKLDAEFNTFTEALLEQLLPNYLAPTPAAMMVEAKPDFADPDLAEGKFYDAGSYLDAVYVEREQRFTCRFRLSAPLAMWPLIIDKAAYFSSPGPMQGLGLDVLHETSAGLRLRFHRKSNNGPHDPDATPKPGEKPDLVDDVTVDELPVYFSGNRAEMSLLYEQMIANRLRVTLRYLDRRGDPAFIRCPPDIVGQIGFADEERLFPEDDRLYQGYALLREYFVLPQKFLGVRIKGLRDLIRRVPAPAFDLLFEFDRAQPRLGSLIEAKSFRLYAVPAVNLFEERCSRIQPDDKHSEYLVRPDPSPAANYEVHRLLDVWAHYEGVKKKVRVHRLYDLPEADVRPQDALYFTFRRRPRRLTEQERRFGFGGSYIGGELFLSLYQPTDIDDATRVARLSAAALCSNRHLTEQLPLGQAAVDFRLVDDVTVALACIAGPTAPRPSIVQLERTEARTGPHGEVMWRLINGLQLNHLGLRDRTPDDPAGGLREILSLFADGSDAVTERNLRGLTSVESRAITRSLRRPDGYHAARGIEVRLTFDERAYEGVGIALLGAVLDRFFADYTTINSFTETVLVSEQRGEVIRFAPRSGTGPLL